MNLITTLIGVAAFVYVLARQLAGEPLRGRQLLVIPAVLVLWGGRELGQPAEGIQPAVLALLSLEGVTAVALGIVRGLTVVVFEKEGVLWYRATVATLAVWGLSISLRIGGAMLAGLLGVGLASTTPTILLMFGLTLGAQNAVMAMRAQSLGVPFAPSRREERRRLSRDPREAD